MTTRNSSDMSARVVKRYLQAGVQPIQDLAGVQTWVSKNRQDGVQDDRTAPEKSRADYQDGVPQRDRVLPLPSGHPKGRDEQRLGPPISNTPPDSSGAPLGHSQAPNPNAIPNQPDGKPLHQRPRSSGLPGEQYGHPYIESWNTTGLARRTMTADDHLATNTTDSKNRQLSKGDITVHYPRKRQRRQKGALKRYYEKRKFKLRTRNRLTVRNKAKRYYRRNKARIKRYQALYRRNSSRFKRYEGGGNTSISQRDNRQRRASMQKDAVRDILSVMYKQIHAPVAQTSVLSGELVGEELIARARYRSGPGSRSTPQMQRARGIRSRRRTPSRLKSRKYNKRYYKKNRARIRMQNKKWRKKNRTKLKRYVAPSHKKAASAFLVPLTFLLEGGLCLFRGFGSDLSSVEVHDFEFGSLSIPTREFFALVEWIDDEDREVFIDLSEEILDNYSLVETDMRSEQRVWGSLLGLNGSIRLASGIGQDQATLAALQILLAVLRGAHWSHWTSHWQASGASYYGDHQLLQRIYEGVVEEIDTLAEKIVGTYGAGAVKPVDQAQLMVNTLLPIAELQSEGDPLKRALIVEEALQKLFKKVYSRLKASDSLSLGLDDFIMSMANNHETYLYLLRQRHRNS